MSSIGKRKRTKVDDTAGRHGEVGGIPRHVFANDDDLEETLVEQLEAVNKLPKRYAFFLAEGEINAKEDLDFEDVPKSPIMGYKKIGKGISLYSWAAATVPHTLFELFGKGEVVLISPSAEGKFARKFIKDFWPLTMVPKWLED